MTRLVGISILIVALAALHLGCSDKSTGCCELTITNAPEQPVSVYVGQQYRYQFRVLGKDTTELMTWEATSVGNPPTGAFTIYSTGAFTFVSDTADAGHSFEFRVSVTDPRGTEASASITIAVDEGQPFRIKVQRRYSYLGSEVTVPVEKLQPSSGLKGFQLMVGFPRAALALRDVRMGNLLETGDWESLTYEFAGNGISLEGERLSFVRINAAADILGTPERPQSYAEDIGQLVLLDFAITEDTEFDCARLPIEFVWTDCTDNVFWDVATDTPLISLVVYDWRWAFYYYADQYIHNDEDCATGAPYTFGGACPECEAILIGHPQRLVNFESGFVQLICEPTSGINGDLNLNGIDNEIADLVLYSRYFLFGDSVFDIAKDVQIMVSDVNNDGQPLTIADQTFLTRIITGDALPFPRLAPYEHSLTASFTNGLFTTEATAEVGALWAQFNVSGDHTIEDLTTMELDSNLQDGVLNVLVWAGTNHMTNAISFDRSDIFKISGGNPQLLYLEASDYDGNLMTVLVRTTEGVMTFTPEARVK